MTTYGPWHIDIKPWQSWVASSGTTPARQQVGALLGLEQLANGTGADGDSVSWDVPLGAGTWTITVIHRTAASQGIWAVKLDGVSVGSKDAYSAGTVDNVVTQFTGVAVAADGVARLRVEITGKHASSSGRQYTLEHITLSRTA